MLITTRKLTEEEKEDSLIEGCNLVMVTVKIYGSSACFPIPKHLVNTKHYHRLIYKLVSYAKDNSQSKRREKIRRNREKDKQIEILGAYVDKICSED